MANPDWEKGGKSPNPKGRGKGNKDKDPTPAEMRRMLSKLKKITPEALDILIEEMVKVLPDGTIIKNEKIAERLIQLYFQTLKVSEDLKSKKPSSDPVEAPVEEKKPKFSLTVINPQTKDKLNVSGE